MGRNAIEVEELSKRYFLGEDHTGTRNLREAIVAGVRRVGHARPPRSEVWSLRDVSFEVPEGSAVGVIGRNGAGKSTLLKVLTRITEPTEGVARTRGRVGSLLEVGTGFHPELTGRENVFLNGAILGMGWRAIERRYDEIVAFAGVERFLDTPVKRYSSGMYLRLAFSVAAHLDADILLVDEVLAVGDAEFQRKCLGLMGDIERQGRTVVFVSHNLEAIVRLCPTCVWLDQGRMVEMGPAGDVIDTYLSAGVQQMDRRIFDDVPDQLAAARSIGIVNPAGQTTSVLRRDEPFTIEVAVSVRRPAPGLNVAISIESLRGVRMLDEALFDHNPTSLEQPGDHILRLTVPPVLNSGDYVVNLWLGTDYEDLGWFERALSFHLEGVTAGRSDRVLRLDLPWQVTRVSGGSPVETG